MRESREQFSHAPLRLHGRRAQMAVNEASLAYDEPPTRTIVILSGFLLLLNAVNYGLDRWVYCGLLGQVLLGIAWGTPGAKWLSDGLEHSVVQLGFLGLNLIVYEGEIHTRLPLMAYLYSCSGAVFDTHYTTRRCLNFVPVA